MNIIQQQELARNSSEQQLIDLASQPNPSIIPPYLVTGELMRRKSIREKFAQAPQQSVSEEVLTEAIQENQPQGIGALTEDMATPMTAPQMPQEEVMTESISETGIANLPAPNIGQNYAGGGIIGFQPGGYVFDPYADGGKGGYINSSGAKAVPFNKAGLPALTGAGLAAEEARKRANAFGKQMPWYKSLGKKALGYVPGIVKRNPWVAGGLGVAGLIGLTGDDDEPELPPVPTLPASFYKPEPVDYTKDIDFSGMTIEDTAAYGDKMMEDHRNRMGTDPFTAKRNERLAALEKDIGSSDDALNMALIRGGLGMASGESSNFLTNLSEGLTKGVDAYVEEDDKQRQREIDLFTLQNQIAQAERAEQVAIATTGTNSQATAEANNRKVELKKIEAQLTQEQLDIQAATAAQSPNNMMLKIIQQVDKVIEKEFPYGTTLDAEGAARKEARKNQLTQQYMAQLNLGGGQGYQPTTEEITLLQQFSS